MPIPKYAVLVGNEKIVEQYQMIGFPTTYLIGRDGKIVKKYIGTAPDNQFRVNGEVVSSQQRDIEQGNGISI